MSEAKVRNLIPQIGTTDLEGTIDFYTSKLGFDVGFRYEDFYAGIRVGDHLIHLKRVDVSDPSIPFVAAGGHLHLCFETGDVDEPAAQFRANAVPLISEPADTPRGMRECRVADDQGDVLCFGQARA